MSFNLNSLWLDWRAKVPDGTPNPSNAYHLVLLKELCLKQGIDKDIIDNVMLVMEKDEKIDPDTPIKYKLKNKNTGEMEDKETTYKSALQRDKEHPAYIAAKALQSDDGTDDDEEDKSEPMQIDPAGGLGPDDGSDSYSKLSKTADPKKKHAADIEKQKAAEKRKEELRKKIREKIKKNAKTELDPKVRIPNKEVRKELNIDEFVEKKTNEAILELLPDDLKKKAVLDGNFDSNKGLLTAYGLLYGGRVNSGFLKNSYNKVDVDQLRRNENNLKELYDDAEKEKVERGVRKVRNKKISEKEVIETFDALPSKLQQYLMGAGNGGDSFIGNGEGKESAGHFLGYTREDGTHTTDVSEFENDDYDATQPESDTNKRWKTGKPPKVVRGNVGSRKRGLHVWRVFKEQGGLCAYSGLPLVLEEMDLEHVVGLKNNDTDDPNDIDVKKAREHGANHVLCLTKYNQIKKDKSMDDWIEDHNKPLYDKKQSDFDALEKGKAEGTEIRSITTQTALTQMDEVHYKLYGGKTISKSDYDALDEMEKKNLKIRLTDQKTPKVASAKLGDKVTFETLDKTIKDDLQKYLDLEEALLDKVTLKSDREKIKSLKRKGKIGKRLIQSMGLSGQFAADRRSVEMGTDKFFQSYALSMANASPEDGPKYKKAWKEARDIVNKKKNGKLVIRPAPGNSTSKSEQMKKFIEIIKGKNLIPKKVSEDPRFSDIWG